MNKMNLVIFLVTLTVISAIELTGHLKSIGEQRKGEGHIDILEEIPDQETFYKKYIHGSRPVVFKYAAKNMPAFNLWTDEYMEKTFGDLKCDVEEGKKENRSLGMFQWNYKEFLNKYKKEDIYMVNSLKGKMLADLRLFPCLSCGGFDRVINDIIMWFSSGGTSSVLHNDQVDNMNCLFSGTKELYMVDPKYEEFIQFDSADGSHSLVDPDAVNLEKYPGLAKAPWWKAKMEAGDCLFIPFRWFHQVRSFSVDNRNMAVNVWFSHLRSINTTDCKNNKNAGKFIPLDQITLGDVEFPRFILKLILPDGKSIERKAMIKELHAYSRGFIDKPTFAKIVRSLDPNKDKIITIEEIDALTKEQVQLFRNIFPGAISEQEDEESAEEATDESEKSVEGTKDEYSETTEFKEEL